MKEDKFEDFYELKSFIGRGSFGEVRKCICRKTDELFAVKEIQFDLDEEAREKAENEAQVRIKILLINARMVYYFSRPVYNGYI